jgi:hypothetical protein
VTRWPNALDDAVLVLMSSIALVASKVAIALVASKVVLLLMTSMALVLIASKVAFVSYELFPFFLLIEFLHVRADVRKAPPAMFSVVRLSLYP